MVLAFSGLMMAASEVTLDRLSGLRYLQGEVDGLLLSQTGNDVIRLCGLESLRFSMDGVAARR